MINTKSIRFRLTLWYAVSLVLATVVIFAGFYFITRKVFYTQTDNELTSHGDKIVGVITSQTFNMHDNLAKETFVREFSQIPGMLVIVMNNSGSIVSSSQTVNPDDAVMKAIFNEDIKVKGRLFEDRVMGLQKLRFLASPIYQDGRFLGIVIVGHPIEAMQNALASLATTLGAVFLVFSLSGVAGGYINAAAAVRPVSLISEKLKKINSGNLDERVDNPKTGDEIEELSVTFNSLLDRLHGAFQRERQFIGDVAHELKTPLTAQRTNLEIALTKNKNAGKLRTAISEALTDNNELSSTLKNVLDLAWAEADISGADFDKINLTEMVDDLRDLAIRMGVKKKLHVAGTSEAGIKVLGKKDKLFGALLNIVDNAVKYTPQKGTVDLTLEKKNGYAEIKVRDSGAGISKKDLPHIFERFYRGTKTNGESGTGLGLAIAKATISAFGGKIKVKSKEKKGSEFVIFLPLLIIS